VKCSDNENACNILMWSQQFYKEVQCVRISQILRHLIDLIFVSLVFRGLGFKDQNMSSFRLCFQFSMFVSRNPMYKNL